MGRLEDKVAIVTGAARGTGEVIARRFTEEGARVVLADVREDQGRAVADALGKGARFEALDVREPEAWRSVVERTVGDLGRIDVLVNNAAILLLAGLHQTTRADFLRIVEVNQLGPFLGIQAVFPHMRDQGGGSIVNISSSDGIKGMNGVVAYSSSKWGVRGLAKSAAIELGRYAIRVNTICPEAGNPDMSAPFFPGLDLTDIPHQLMQKILKAPESTGPASRLVDVANMAVYLGSDESQSCTGADFVIDAGLTVGWYNENLPTA